MLRPVVEERDLADVDHDALKSCRVETEEELLERGPGREVEFTLEQDPKR
jgi:hypothetical protein